MLDYIVLIRVPKEPVVLTWRLPAWRLGEKEYSELAAWNARMLMFKNAPDRIEKCEEPQEVGPRDARSENQYSMWWQNCERGDCAG